jgi:hypothetical protein
MNNDPNRDAETVYIDGNSTGPSNLKKHSQVSHHDQHFNWTRIANNNPTYSNSFKNSPKTSKGP